MPGIFIKSRVPGCLKGHPNPERNKCVEEKENVMSTQTKPDMRVTVGDRYRLIVRDLVAR